MIDHETVREALKQARYVVATLQMILDGAPQETPTRKQRRPAEKKMPVVDWTPSAKVMDWISSTWKGVPYDAALDNFKTFFETTGLTKTQTSWDLTLRRNDPFKCAMNRGGGVVAGKAPPRKTIRDEGHDLAVLVLDGKVKTVRDCNNTQRVALDWLINNNHAYITHDGEIKLSA